MVHEVVVQQPLGREERCADDRDVAEVAEVEGDSSAPAGFELLAPAGLFRDESEDAFHAGGIVGNAAATAGGDFAVIADVTVSKDGKLKVNKLSAACDVGPIMNLSGAENQVQGSMIDGLSAAWFQEILVENGAVQQTNFHEYPLLTIKDAPQVEVHFAKSDFPPTGLGEPALPPTAPAITNAIFAATGKRIRTLPLVKQDLSWG